MMTEVNVLIGGRNFSVACKPGEESEVTSAAQKFNIEAENLIKELGRLPENKMLLMAGLMLGDRLKNIEWEHASYAERLAEVEMKLRAAEVKLSIKSERDDYVNTHAINASVIKSKDLTPLFDRIILELDKITLEITDRNKSKLASQGKSVIIENSDENQKELFSE
jgi:cell division protein ZapA